MDDTTNALKQTLANLKEEQENLIEILKTKYRDIYDWLEENNVNPRTLGAYAKNIAVAVIITYSALNTTSGQQMENYSYQKEQRVLALNSDRLKQEASPDELRAVDVWHRYEDEILETSIKYDLDPKVIFATIMVESGGNEKAIRYEPHINDASYGLGQLLYGTAVNIGFNGPPQGLYDPGINIDLIGRYHQRNVEVYGDLSVEQLATAYNAGNPYGSPTYGHVDKFVKWYNVLNELTKV